MANESKRSLLTRLYPRLYHMGHVGSWPSIEQHGLLSTTALLDLFQIDTARRFALESSRRVTSQEITHPAHGRALLRDQYPLNIRKLEKSLQDGLTSEQWLLMLNRKVFFWGPKSRLEVLQTARLYDGARQTIIEVDTNLLLERYEDRMLLCPINSGATQPMAHPRGLRSFLPLDDYPLVERLGKYGKDRAVAEITVDYAVPDLRELVLAVYEMGGNHPREDLLVARSM